MAGRARAARALKWRVIFKKAAPILAKVESGMSGAMLQAFGTAVIMLVSRLVAFGGMWAIFLALAIIVGLPSFFKAVPETIRALSELINTYRRTSHKIATDRDKVRRAMSERQNKKLPSNKGKKP